MGKTSSGKQQLVRRKAANAAAREAPAALPVGCSPPVSSQPSFALQQPGPLLSALVQQAAI